METVATNSRAQLALGQKYAYATVSLVLGVMSFVNLLGIEKGILAIAFGLLAIASGSGPALAERRGWGKLGVILGAIQVVLVVGIVAFNFDKVLEVIRMLEQLGEGR